MALRGTLPSPIEAWPFTSDLAMHYICLIACESALLVFLMKSSECISNFHARKICHAGTGLMLLQLDSRDRQAQRFVYIFSFVSLLITWEMVPAIKPFRWARKKDIGMTVYCCVASLWFGLGMPVYVLAPMFFADPAGAVVGKYLSGLKGQGYEITNPVWWSHGGVTKTVGGSLAVFVFTVLSFAGPASLLARFVVGICAVFAEAIGGAYDNLLLVLLAVGSRSVFNFFEFGTFSLWAGGDGWTF